MSIILSPGLFDSLIEDPIRLARMVKEMVG
jgi:hypothetical protein